MAVIPNFPQNLRDIHHNWHQPGAHPGAGQGRTVPQGFPGSGIEFLTFHRNFIAMFHAWYDNQPNADQVAVAPWLAIPNELKALTAPPNTMQVAWSANRAAQEARIVNNNPAFADADDLGIFIETTIHNWIHGATAVAFNEPSVADLHSPQSTYFYKIHGLVDYWWRQWERRMNPKSFIKDVIDNQPKLILKERIKEQLKERIKENIKEIVKDNVPDKPLKEKDKDKDIFEGGFPGERFDPVIRVEEVMQQLANMQQPAEMGQAFIHVDERPDVGSQVVKGARRKKPNS